MTVKFTKLLNAAVITAAFVLSATPLVSQTLPHVETGASALGSAIASLGTNTRVLVIAAHPDDEDTGLISWLSRGRHVETAYLSLTRGDGGQNLIGNELGEALGIIRTQEMLEARHIDGGKQFFTRAYDFGFSKNADETLTHWPRDTILGDVVRTVRSFRPHVIIAFFSGTPRDGHGHHQVSGIFAREAYDLSGDTIQFPTATHGAPWVASKFYRSARQVPDSATLRLNTGEFNPLLGKSYAEIAGASRSQHKSQGFGAPQPKGIVWSYIMREHSRVNAAVNASDEGSVFDGIDTSWTRLGAITKSPVAIAALDSAALMFGEARKLFRGEAPAATVKPLARAVALLRIARDSGAAEPAGWGNYQSVRRGTTDSGNRSSSPYSQDEGDLWSALTVSIKRAEKALLLASGVAVEALSTREELPVRLLEKNTVNDSLPVLVTLFNRGSSAVSVTDVTVPVRRYPVYRDSEIRRFPVGVVLAPDSQYTVHRSAASSMASQSWWRNRGRNGAWFVQQIGAEDELSRQETNSIVAQATIEIEGVRVLYSTPVVRRIVDPVRGQVETPVVAVNGITVGFNNVVEYIRADVPIERDVRVNIRSAYDTAANVLVALSLPAGLVADSAEKPRTVPPGSGMTVVFKVKGKIIPGRHQLGATAYHEGTAERSGFYTISYDHIPRQNMYAPSGMWLSSVSAAAPSNIRVGYIAGVGDHGAEALSQLGVTVDKLEPSMLDNTDLSRYASIVVGPRAYDVHKELPAKNSTLLRYAQNGGNLVVQYGQYEMLQPGIMPYPIQLTRPASRVTVENSTVRVLDVAAALLTRPNRINDDDFAGWVQERATYMPTSADMRYTPLLAMNDPEEPENRGGLLTASVGKGRYVYVTLSLFRQLPAGVPGAARLLLNLITPPVRTSPAGAVQR